jgi:two-component system, NarL family, invasion response regulator UvrY
VITVLIGDDHAIFRAGLIEILEGSGGLRVVAEAATVGEVLERAASDRPDLVVLDITMPGRGGIATLAELKRCWPRIKVLVLTLHPEEAFAVRCLREGADGYLTKDAAPERLVAAVRKIIGGGKFVSPALAERLVRSLELDAGRPAHERLSGRELQVMRLIGAGKTVSEIAALLALSVKTVSTYRARVLEKMGMRTTSEIMRYVIAAGIED